MLKIVVLRIDGSYDNYYGRFRKVIDRRFESEYYEVVDRNFDFVDSFEAEDFKVVYRNEDVVIIEETRF